MLPQIDNEEEVYVIPQHSITVTTKRIVQHRGNSRSNFECKTILLTDISFCGVTGAATNWMLYAAIAFSGFFLYGLSQEKVTPEANNPFFISLMIGAICVIAYALSIKKIIREASSGGRIDFESKSLIKEDLYQFLSSIQEAKLMLMRELRIPVQKTPDK